MTTPHSDERRTIRLRQPLAQAVIVAPDADALAPLAGLIAQELNVKDVRVIDVTDPAATAFGLRERVLINARVAGPRLGRRVQEIIAAARDGLWERTSDGTLHVDGVALAPHEYRIETVAPEADGRWTMATLDGGGFVALDTQITDELAAEGLARDLAAGISKARRDANLGLNTRVAVTVTGRTEVIEAVTAHEALIRRATLATEVTTTVDPRAQGTDVRVRAS